MKLLSLPHELLTTVCGHVDWDDIFRIRLACKGLKEISHTRETWAAILSRYILTGRIPQPFCLPKPLPNCSSRDLERSIAAWESPWPAVVSTSFTEALIDDFDTSGRRLPIADGMGMRILPGGRWVLAQLNDGSVSYLDLQGLSKSQSSRIYLKPLLPAAFRYQEFVMEWCDFDIDVMLEPTLENHHLAAFNLAVGVSYRPREGGNGSEITNQMNVWRVRVVGSSLRAERLSTFNDPLVSTLNGWGRLCLMGRHVAYVRRYISDDESALQCVAVVQWQGLNDEEGPADGLVSSPARWLLPTPTYDVSEILLLPDERIFVCCDHGEAPNMCHVIRLYDWRHGVGDSHNTDPEALSQVELEPLWVSRELSTTEFQWEAPFRFPYFMPDGEVRLGTRCPAGLSGVRIPSRSARMTSPQGLTPAVIIECLIKDETRRGDRSENTHYSRTVSLQRHQAFYHPWDGRNEAGKKPASHLDFDPAILNNSFDFEKPMYDPFSRRVVYLSDRTDSTICVLDLLLP